MDFTDQHKEEIERQIVEVIATGVENKELQESDLGEISEFVLDRIDLIKNKQELLAFLSDLSVKWAIFSSVLLIEEGKMKTDQEKLAVGDVTQLANNGNIDEAIKLAKTITNSN